MELGRRQPTCYDNTEDLALDIIFVPANGYWGDFSSRASSSPAKKLHPPLSSWTSVTPRFWAEGPLQPLVRLIWLLHFSGGTGGAGRRQCELCPLPLGLKVLTGSWWLSQDRNTEKAPGTFFRDFQQEFPKPICYCSLVKSYPRKCLQSSTPWSRRTWT